MMAAPSPASHQPVSFSKCASAITSNPTAATRNDQARIHSARTCRGESPVSGSTGPVSHPDELGFGSCPGVVRRRLVFVLVTAETAGMLPRPPRAELRRRLPRLMFGLFLFGIGLAFMVVADLGLAPWEVLHQGISGRTGIPIGTVGIITGLIVLIAWFPIGERFGVGTLANVIFIGIVIDVSLWIFPNELDGLVLRWVAMIGGLVLVAIGSGYYIGVHLGPGPRDGLMTGLSRRTGRPIGLVRAIIEVSVLVAGWLLGGTVGAGTVAFAFGIGPLVQVFLHRLSVATIDN